MQMSKTPLENELQFSTNKITKNFSNYSSWHYRSELLPRIYPSSSGDTLLDDQKLAEGNSYSFTSVGFNSKCSHFSIECNLIQNAIFTDPNDQSAWFYQRWLLFTKKESDSKENSKNSGFLSVLNDELESCQQLRDLEPNNKCIFLSLLC